LLTIAWYFIFPSIFDGKLFLGGDNANYFILAEGLSSGQGFTQISSPNMTPGNHFPPGYPFIMSIFMRLGYEDLLIFKWLNGVFLLMSSFVFFGISLLLTKHRWFSFAMGYSCSSIAHLLEYSTVMMSENPPSSLYSFPVFGHCSNGTKRMLSFRHPIYTSFWHCSFSPSTRAQLEWLCSAQLFYISS